MGEETTAVTATGLTAQQLAYFHAFGFVRLPGFLGADTPEIIAAFDDVFARNEGFELRTDVHFGRRRLAIPGFLDEHPRLKALETDPRIVAVVDSLFDDGWEFRQSDGNVMDCDTSWHCDIYDSPLERFHVKLFFYLDALDGESGALRVIPGTSHYQSEFAAEMRQLDPWTGIASRYGVPPEEIPSWPVPNEPGDLIVGNYRTVHATFGGREGRRLFTMNYRAREV